mgnify:CR=1 FL=1
MNIGILEEIMQTVTVYTGPYCPYCTMAKRLLQAVGVKEINEIFIGDTHVGGFTDLYRLQQEGKLDELLNP